jgi:hypothetical protein
LEIQSSRPARGTIGRAESVWAEGGWADRGTWKTTCLGRSAAARSGSTRSLRRGGGMSDMWREQETGLSGTWSCVRCREGAENEGVLRSLRYIHNDFYYLPAVAAAMLAVLPSLDYPTDTDNLMFVASKQFQYCCYRTCLSHISTQSHELLLSLCAGARKLCLRNPLICRPNVLGRGELYAPICKGFVRCTRETVLVLVSGRRSPSNPSVSYSQYDVDPRNSRCQYPRNEMTKDSTRRIS